MANATVSNEQEVYPMVSVIIPATRPLMIEQTLQRLRQQRYAGTFEIIVVAAFADRLAQCWPILAVNTEPIREPGRARNLGAKHAKGDILLFVDDDMLMLDDWIAQNVAALKEPGVGAVGARMPGSSTAFFARCVDFTNCGYYQHNLPAQGPLGSGSMAIARIAFQQSGGFDELLCSNEDIDLCYRLRQLGYQTLYQPQIVVIHDHKHHTFAQLLRYNFAHGLAVGLTIKIRYHKQTVKNRLLYSIRFPPIFLLFLPIIALCTTIQIVALNVGNHKRVLLYAPFILSGKLAYEFGIFVHILKD